MNRAIILAAERVKQAKELFNTTNILNILLILILLFVLASCKKKKVYSEALAFSMCKVQDDKSFSPPENSEYNPKLIKKGDLIISSLNLENTKKQVYSFVKNCNGYVTSEKLVSNLPYSQYQITLNIQASYFDRFVFLIDSSKLDVVSRNFSTEDVTMQFVDDSTRLVNKRVLEKRYLELLSKTKDVKDLMEIEGKLEEIRADIEVKENQLKIMRKQVNFSAFSITINKQNNSLSWEKTNTFAYKICNGLAEGWEGIKSFCVFIITIWPVYFLLGLLYWVIKHFVKRRKKE